MALASMLAAASLAPATGCGNGDDGSSVSPAHPRAVPPTNALERKFAVFARPRTKADEIPASLLPRNIADDLGLDLTTSRLADGYAGAAVYIVTSRRLTCVYSQHPAISNCWPTQVVAQGRASATSLCGMGTKTGEIMTYGIVPDRVKKVTILREKEPDRTVPVVGNLYVGVTSSKPPLPVRLAFVEDGKRVIGPTGIPRGLARRGCTTGKPPRLGGGLL